MTGKVNHRCLPHDNHKFRRPEEAKILILAQAQNRFNFFAEGKPDQFQTRLSEFNINYSLIKNTGRLGQETERDFGIGFQADLSRA